ncbi:MAG TPA: histone deacetylase [Haliangiales bacterium]|nr:histone deacetylase [Haliangiales bacterium]
MGKYARLREALVARGLVRAGELTRSEPGADIVAAIRGVHDAAYVDGFLGGALDERAQRRIGFPWSEALVRRTLASANGTLLAARAALADGIAGNLAGGTHHAHAGFGAGFCVFNDIAVAARALLDERRVARVLVVDVDVHQGDGTAAIFAREPAVFTLSLHGARNFPFRKERSSLDVELPDGSGDDAYLARLEGALAEAFAFAPDIVFVQAGVDALAEDRLGRLALTLDGLFRRDRRILGEARRRGVPAVLTLGGGYAEPLDLTVEAHVGTYRAAAAVYRDGISR